MKTCREGSILGSYWKILLAAMRMSQRYVLESKILSAQKFRRGKRKNFLNFLCSVMFQLHAGIAEVAAAKARMFVNKPDGSKCFSGLS